MKQRALALLAAFGLALGMIVATNVVTAPQNSVAKANECTIQWGGMLCGKIAIRGSNTIWLVHSWPNTSVGGYFRPGTYSTDVWKDTDGFVTRPGWCTNVRLYAEDGYTMYMYGHYGQGNVKLPDRHDFYYVWTWDC